VAAAEAQEVAAAAPLSAAGLEQERLSLGLPLLLLPPLRESAASVSIPSTAPFSAPPSAAMDPAAPETAPSAPAPEDPPEGFAGPSAAAAAIAIEPEESTEEQQGTALDQEIRGRKISQARGGAKPADDVLQRCLEMQSIGTPGMDDLGIRNYLIGFVIGAIPTLSAAATQIVDELLNRPEQLALAQAAARNGKPGEFEGYLFEALRYQPLNPVLYRRAVRDSTIARGTWRAMTIPAGTMVLASNYSAMFDPMQVEHADRFWPGRPWHDYILWGYGMHTCAGAYINSALLPVMLRPLFCRPHLRRSPGAKGQIDRGTTPFPAHLALCFDAE
jgi:cytochrome P450